MNILITGAGGYLGCHLTELLLQSGHHVIALDNFSEQSGTLNHLCSHPNLEIVRGDCRNPTLMAQLMMKADVIIPLAALVGVARCEEDQQAAKDTNRAAIALLCRLAAENHRIIYPCTNSGYGIRGEGICTEKSSFDPISLYGNTKADGEIYVMERENSISFRFATLFGMSPRMRWGLLVNDFVRRAILDRSIVLFESHFRRNFLHVRDAAHCFLWAIEHWDAMKGQIYNAGLSTANLSKRELAERIKCAIPELCILEAPTRKDPDQRNYIVSNDKLHATGWLPNYPLGYGIVELLKGVKCVD